MSTCSNGSCGKCCVVLAVSMPLPMPGRQCCCNGWIDTSQGVAFKLEKAALTAIKDIDLDACLFNSSVGAEHSDVEYSDVMVACNNANAEVFMLNIC